MRNALSWLVFASFALVAPPQALAQWWNPLAPKAYEDCVLKGMKGVSGDQAANIVAAACRGKFPLKKDGATCYSYRSLNKEEQEKIDGGSPNVFGTKLSLPIYNGSNVTLYKAGIVTIIRGVRREYEAWLDYPIKPKSTGVLSTIILDEEAWSTSEEKGVKIRNLQTCRF
jgi:hypothetical protein